MRIKETQGHNFAFFKNWRFLFRVLAAVCDEFAMGLANFSWHVFYREEEAEGVFPAPKKRALRTPLESGSVEYSMMPTVSFVVHWGGRDVQKPVSENGILPSSFLQRSCKVEEPPFLPAPTVRPSASASSRPADQSCVYWREMQGERRRNCPLFARTLYTHD